MMKQLVSNLPDNTCPNPLAMSKHPVSRRPLASRTRLIAALILSLSLALSSCSTDDSDATNNQTIGSRIAEARPGDVIQLITQESYEGTFRVPAGVTIDGGGATIQGTGAAVFILEPGAETTVIRNLTILNDGVGIITRAPTSGRVEISNVTIQSRIGAGLIIEGASELILSDLTLDGLVTDADLAQIGSIIDPRQRSVLGIAAWKVQSVQMNRVDIKNYAGFGAAFYQSPTTWSFGTVSGCVGVSVIAEDSLLHRK